MREDASLHCMKGTAFSRNIKKTPALELLKEYCNAKS